jgi:acyl-CoA thioester hydrolase
LNAPADIAKVRGPFIARKETLLPRVAPELLEPDRYPLSFEVTTRYADLDTNGHINNVAMAAIFEDVRIRAHQGERLRELMPGTQTVVVSVQTDYVAEAFYPAPMWIGVGMFELGGSSWTTVQLAIQEGRPRALSRAVAVNIRDGRPERLTDAARALLSTRMFRRADGVPG